MMVGLSEMTEPSRSAATPMNETCGTGERPGWIRPGRVLVGSDRGETGLDQTGERPGWIRPGRVRVGSDQGEIGLDQTGRDQMFKRNELVNRDPAGWTEAHGVRPGGTGRDRTGPENAWGKAGLDRERTGATESAWGEAGWDREQAVGSDRERQDGNGTHGVRQGVQAQHTWACLVVVGGGVCGCVGVRGCRGGHVCKRGVSGCAGARGCRRTMTTKKSKRFQRDAK